MTSKEQETSFYDQPNNNSTTIAITIDSIDSERIDSIYETLSALMGLLPEDSFIESY